MKIVKNILLTLLGIVLLLLIISFFLPSKSHVERAMVMKAKPEQVYKLVSNYHEWHKWSPWHKKDTAAVMTYNDITEGMGASYTWKSNNKEVGAGEQKIVEAEPNKKVVSEMHFEGMGKSYASFILTPEEGGVKVTWAMDGDSKDMPVMMRPISKYFSLMMDKMVGPDFEKGLTNMKEVVENGKPSLTIGGYDAQLKELPAMDYIGIRNKLKGAEISKAFTTYVSELMAEMKKQGVEQAGPIFSINYSAKGDLYDMEVCIPVKTPMKAAGNIKPGNKAATKALVVNYYGDYMHIGKVYQPGFEYMSQQHLNASGAPMEFYITDPMMEKDTAKWLTEVVLPCQ
ncbi:MAG: SRPBCC family protein [Bacteroidia bacterium]|nr:SRPBCC family protein [Bacteroidia bacterium]